MGGLSLVGSAIAVALVVLQILRHLLLMFDWDFQSLTLRVLLPNTRLFAPEPGSARLPASTLVRYLGNGSLATLLRRVSARSDHLLREVGHAREAR